MGGCHDRRPSRARGTRMTAGCNAPLGLNRRALPSERERCGFLARNAACACVVFPLHTGPDLGSNRLKWSAWAGPPVGDSEAVHANEGSLEKWLRLRNSRGLGQVPSRGVSSNGD